MPPEVAAGQRTLSAAADVYGLGAVLYECLTGRPPFVGVSPLFVLTQVTPSDRLPPRLLDPQVPRDLATVCLKCLHKDPARRYPSADDLRRWLDGVSVRARPVGVAERAAKWARRRPALVAAWAAAATALAVIAVVVAVNDTNLRAESNRARRGEQAAREARIVAEGRLVDLSAALAMRSDAEDDLPTAALWFAAAARQSADHPERAQLNRHRWRAWTNACPVPWRAVRIPGGRSERLALHPDGIRLAAGRDGVWSLWDLEAETPAEWPGPARSVTAAAFSPDGRLLATGSDAGLVFLHSVPSGREVGRWEAGGRSAAVAFSGDGSTLAFSGGRRLLLVRPGAGTPPIVLPEQAGEVLAAVFSPSGSRVVVLDATGSASVYDLATPGKAIFGPVGHDAGLPTGWDRMPGFLGEDRLVTSQRISVTVWDLATGKEAATVRPGHFSGVEATIGPDGRSFLARHDFDSPALWHGPPPQEVTFSPRPPFVECAAYDPAGEFLLLGHRDGARLWRRDGTPASPALWHPGGPRPVACSSGGRWLATTAEDGLVRLWRRRIAALPRTVGGSHAGTWGLRAGGLSEDGTRLLDCRWDENPGLPTSTASVFSPHDGRQAGPRYGFQ
jgi:WD40 repeat protein